MLYQTDIPYATCLQLFQQASLLATKENFLTEIKNALLVYSFTCLLVYSSTHLPLAKKFSSINFVISFHSDIFFLNLSTFQKDYES